MSLFQKRHYEWLARWAGEALTQAQTFDLSCSLSSADPTRKFKHETFMKAARQHREARKPHLLARREEGAI